MKGSSDTSRIMFSVIACRVPLCGCQFAKEIMRHLSQICRILPSGDSGSAGKPRLADHTPVSDFRDLRFCCRKSVCARRFPLFPALPKTAIKNPLSQSENMTNPPRKQPLKRENRLSAVPTDQTGRTVARPHRAYPPPLR